MRFFTAAVMYLVSLAMILTGVAERTVWAPAPSKVFSIQLEEPTPYLIIQNATLKALAGAPQLKLSGATNNVVIQGRESDIIGWLGSDTYTTLVIDPAKEALMPVLTEGVRTGANPVPSDMWRSVDQSDSELSVALNSADESAVLITNNGFDAPPANISLKWLIPFDLTVSNSLLGAGGVILLGAIIINFWAYYTMRKNRGPKRRIPKAPQGPKYRSKRKRSAPARGRRSAKNYAVALTSGILTVGLLAGCSPLPSASPSPTATVDPNADPAVLNQDQIKALVTEVSTITIKADAAKDPRILAARFTGPALEARQAHYILMSKSKAIKPLDPVSDQVISFTLPAASREWPRTVMVVTNSKKTGKLPQMLVLQQKDPRSLYQVWYDIDMLPSVKFPTVPAAEIGAIPVAADSLFLKLAPNTIAQSFGVAIDQGASSEAASWFDVENDPFYQQVSKSQADTIASLRTAKVTVTHQLANQNVISLATSDSGALVALFSTDTYTIKPAKRKTAVAVEGNEKLLYGKKGSTKGIRTIYGDLLLFYVPGVQSEEKIRTLGATQVLLSVKDVSAR